MDETTLRQRIEEFEILANKSQGNESAYYRKRANYFRHHLDKLTAGALPERPPEPVTDEVIIREYQGIINPDSEFVRVGKETWSVFVDLVRAVANSKYVPEPLQKSAQVLLRSCNIPLVPEKPIRLPSGSGY